MLFYITDVRWEQGQKIHDNILAVVEADDRLHALMKYKKYARALNRPEVELEAKRTTEEYMNRLKDYHKLQLAGLFTWLIDDC